jgi:hypothetical protein
MSSGLMIYQRAVASLSSPPRDCSEELGSHNSIAQAWVAFCRWQNWCCQETAHTKLSPIIFSNWMTFPVLLSWTWNWFELECSWGQRRWLKDTLCFCFCPFVRWFDVLQKVSTQLKTNLTSVTKNRADKVNGAVARYHIAGMSGLRYWGRKPSLRLPRLVA